MAIQVFAGVQSAGVVCVFLKRKILAGLRLKAQHIYFSQTESQESVL